MTLAEYLKRRHLKGVLSYYVDDINVEDFIKTCTIDEHLIAVHDAVFIGQPTMQIKARLVYIKELLKYNSDTTTIKLADMITLYAQDKISRSLHRQIINHFTNNADKFSSTNIRLIIDNEILKSIITLGTEDSINLYNIKTTLVDAIQFHRYSMVSEIKPFNDVLSEQSSMFCAHYRDNFGYKLKEKLSEIDVI